MKQSKKVVKQRMNLRNLNCAAKNRRWKTAVLVLAAVFLWLLALGGCGQDSEAGGTSGSKKPSEPVELRFICAGDVMVHKSQIASQYDSASGTYDYTDNFQYVKPYIEAADLALCNVETTFAGGQPTGYPCFNAPDELADALAWAGFDVGITSNNHMMDKGRAGMQRTLEVLRTAGLETAGSHGAEEPAYTIAEVKGVKVGIVAYTYETPRINGCRTINSQTLSAESEAMINSFGYENLEGDLAEVAETVQAARDAGAEIVICYYHWGEEYQRSPNEWQQLIAKESAVTMGADIIFASHPHVLQGAELIEDEAAGRQIPVFYSMGNFISNQREETLQNRYTEQGMLAGVTLKYDPENGVELVDYDVLPTWVDKYFSGGKNVYAVVPLDGSMEQNGALTASGHLNRAKQALTDVTELIGADIIK